MQMSGHNNSLLDDDELANTAAENQNGISSRVKISGLLNGRRKNEDEDQGLLGSSRTRTAFFQRTRSSGVDPELDQSIYTRSKSKKRGKQVDSLDFEEDESRIWRAYNVQRQADDRGKWWTQNKKRAFARWVYTFFVGVFTGLIAVAITTTARAIQSNKFNHIYDMVEDDGEGFFAAFMTLLTFNLIYGLIAAASAVVEPLAAGSGIPEIKCYLNGIQLPRVVRAKTLVCKAIGVTFTVSAGLPAGKEGPMVHSGAVVAAGISQGKSNVLGCDTSFARFKDFRNDREKRDFVACGAAAGVAAAFGAPIGGVLFSLEEGTSYWSTKLTWRTFFCAMMTVLTLYVVRNAENSFGRSDNTSMFSFGEFFSLEEDQANYSVWELFLFILLGAMGGAWGALFNFFNEKITILRMKHVPVENPVRRIAEALAVTAIMTCVAFGCSAAWTKCTTKPIPDEDWTSQERELVDDLVSFGCDEDTEYNEVASLFITDADTAIKQLFHFRESGDDENNTFSSGALLTFFFPYIIMGCITYGLAVPSGLFVPSLLSGAAFGRLIGHLMHRLDDSSGTFADSGTYALIGAAAVLGGMARMTISLTVIILEATGDMQYVLPLMLTLMTARWVGNIFNEGLYDIHIHLKHLPFLDESPPTIVNLHDIDVDKIMAMPVKYLNEVVSVGSVVSLLTATEHDCFPIVRGEDEGRLLVLGTISRRILATLLDRRAYGPPPRSNDSITPPLQAVALITYDDLARRYPRYPNVEELSFSPDELNCTLDLRPYMNSAPYLIRPSASVHRAYRLFRTLGLRHLVVVSEENFLRGFLTRKDLLASHIEESIAMERRGHSGAGRSHGGMDVGKNKMTETLI